jgi:hypothetical protein
MLEKKVREKLKSDDTQGKNAFFIYIKGSIPNQGKWYITKTIRWHKYTKKVKMRMDSCILSMGNKKRCDWFRFVYFDILFI